MTTKLLLKALALSIALPGAAMAGGTHAGDHGKDKAAQQSHASTDDHHEMMALGQPAKGEVTRTVKVVMREDYEGDKPFVYEPGELTFAAGETVRLHIVNEGEEVHEFVMDTMDANAEHKEVMAKFPEMEHDDPNSVRLEPGQEAEILWTFGKPGTFEFACLIPGHYEGGMHGSLTIN
ncbi:cupredoxin domain-containing protein [Seohaeicola nanhaiensis]|uniref:Cupredoxin domain-containing protein n=1 Tax=Seohaeicola nanhaiensis TaxID=1387282 RepID=A0ABV9KKT1_9RHOB